MTGGANEYSYVRENPLGFRDPYGLYDWTDITIPQWVVNASAGFGDALSFGITNQIRNAMGTNGFVNKCSTSYKSGKYTGYAWGAAMAWTGGLYGGASSVFWSGTGNMARAAELGTTLETTPIGSILSTFGESVPYPVWKLASATFAANAEGTAIKVGVEAGNIWRTIEQPILSFRNIPINFVP